MVKAGALSEQDLAATRAELAGGKPVTVWFTAAAVGVPAGGSAKVVSVEDPPEGDFVQVRPAGSRDTMFCAPNELTRERPARKRAPKAAAAPAAQPSAPRATAPAPAVPEPVATPKQAPSSKPAAVATPAVAPEPASTSASTSAPTPAPKAPAPPSAAAERARPPAGRTPARPATGVTVTLTATPEGEWSVEVAVGKKRTVRPTAVTAGEVAKAARALPPVVTEAIESSLEAARARQLDRVERLRAELEAAQQALKDLSD
jgi:hypothetical protein